VGDEEILEKNTVKFETHKKLLDEKKKRDEDLRIANEKLARFEQEKKQLEERQLQEKEDFKKLYESRDNELKSEREKRIAVETQINDSKKLNAILKNLETPLEQKYWGLIDLDKIPLDPTTGKPDEMVTKQYAEEFKATYWEALNPATGRIPNGAGNGGKVGLSYEQWQKLPYAEKKKRQNEVIN